MNSIRYAWLDKYEISSTACTGLHFARHSHDECVIGVNLLGEEQVWLDRRTFSAGAGNITLYNPGQIQGGGAAPFRASSARPLSHGQTLMFFAGFMFASVACCFLVAALVNGLRKAASPGWQRLSHGLCGVALIYLAILALRAVF